MERHYNFKKVFSSPEKENVNEVTFLIASGGQFCHLMIFLVSEAAIKQVPVLMIIVVMMAVLLNVLFIWNSYLLYVTSSWCPLAKCEVIATIQTHKALISTFFTVILVFSGIKKFVFIM